MQPLTSAFGLVLLQAIAHVTAYTHPNWAPTYQINSSTIIQPCNNEGVLTNPTNGPLYTNFGIIDIDWSNGKKVWKGTKPMTCEENLIGQVKYNRAINPNQKIWVYRNAIKALPWFTTVRVKLEDPNYWGWFIPNKGCFDGVSYTCGTNATTNLYHDFAQTPTGDCGVGVECGEYLFDHRNASLRAWMAGEYIINDKTGLSPETTITGFFFDDSWNSKGPTEMTSAADTVAAIGFSTDDINTMVTAFNLNLKGIHDAVLAHNGFDWQLFNILQLTKAANCASFLKANCGPNTPPQTSTVQYWLTPDPSKKFPQNYSPLIYVNQDLTIFQLIRGDYAWIGYGWIGCNKPWEWPAQFDLDYGTPTSVCSEVAPGVFERSYTKAKFTMDCNNFDTGASIVMNNGKLVESIMLR